MRERAYLHSEFITLNKEKQEKDEEEDENSAGADIPPSHICW